MYQRSLRPPRELPPVTHVPETDEALEAAVFEATEERFQQYLTKRRRLFSLGKTALSVGLAFNTAIAPYLSDVRANMLATSEAFPDVATIIEADTPESSDTTTFFFNGFNANDADYFIKKLGPGYQAVNGGDLASVRYNNAPLSPKLLSEMVVSEINENDIKTVKLVLHSKGAAPGMETVKAILEKTDATIEEITFIESPADGDSLTEKTTEELAIAKNLSWVPFIEYSTFWRLSLEAYFYKDAIEKRPFSTSDGIATRYNNGDMTTNAFLASQINSVLRSDIPKRITELAEYRSTEFMPAINYIMIKGNNDLVVDNAESVEKICKAAYSVELPCSVAVVDAAHGDYFLPKAITEYNRAFAELAEANSPYITQETARHALRLYDFYQMDAINPSNDSPY